MGEPPPRLGPTALLAPERWSRTVFVGVFLTLLSLAAGLRVLAARGDLWFDELWSLLFALDATSPLDIFTGIHHDNNHWLNTLYLYAIGETSHLFLYRAFAVVTGIAMVVVVALEALQRGRTAALTAATLFGGSYVLIHFGSEARGYGPAMFFAVASFFALRAYLGSPAGAKAAIFAVTASLAVLSQLTFAWVYGGMVLWSWFQIRTSRQTDRPRRQELVVSMASLHVVPTAAFVLLLILDVRHWTVGGAGEGAVDQALADLAHYALAVPGPAWAVLTSGGLVLGILGYEILRLRNAGDPLWIFFLLAVLLGPLTFILLWDLSFFFLRYVVISVPFGLILASGALDRIAVQSHRGRITWALLLGAFTTGNAFHLTGFMEGKRGQYEQTVEYILANRPAVEPSLVFSSRSPQEILLEFYQARVCDRLGAADEKCSGEPITIYPSHDWSQGVPSWIISQQPDHRAPEPLRPVTVYGEEFRFERRFPHWGPSGWTWDLYRRARFDAR